MMQDDILANPTTPPGLHRHNRRFFDFEREADMVRLILKTFQICHTNYCIDSFPTYFTVIIYLF